MKNSIETAVNTLVSDQDPRELSNWLWDLQNNLTVSGYVGDLTPSGREEFVGRITALREFFQDLEQIK